MGRLLGTSSYEGLSTTPSDSFVEKGIRYDKVGNILFIKRYGEEGLEKNLGLTYGSGRLLGVTDSLSNGFGLVFQEYDNAGNALNDPYTAHLRYRYNAIGKICEAGSIQLSTTPVGYVLNFGELVDSVKFIYLADGTKIETRHHHSV